jgi:hypothetical protein
MVTLGERVGDAKAGEEEEQQEARAAELAALFANNPGAITNGNGLNAGCKKIYATASGRGMMRLCVGTRPSPHIYAIWNVECRCRCVDVGWPHMVRYSPRWSIHQAAAISAPMYASVQAIMAPE